jgi:sphingomyelin phosphodiesterase
MRTREFARLVCEVDDLTQYRWRSDVNSYPELDGQTKFGPTYVYEYSARATYGSNITWGADEPLNATWWHLVTERASPLSPLVSISRSDVLFPTQR